MPELNNKTQYKFQPYDDLPAPATLCDRDTAYKVFLALFKRRPDYVNHSLLMRAGGRNRRYAG